MKAPFCRVGSKKSLVKKILPLIPPHKVYVEPFVGSGQIFFKKEPIEKEVINDLDSTLMYHYRILKKTKSRDFKKDIDTIEENQAFFNKKATTEGQKLQKEIIRGCNTFGAKGTGKIFVDSNSYPKLKNIDKYQERLKKTTILSQDYKSVMKKYDSKETFFFLDPPYEDSKKLYKRGTINYEEMSSFLKGIKGKFLLTLNDSPNIRNIFNGFKIRSVIARAYGNVRGGGIGTKDRRELIITNYI